MKKQVSYQELTDEELIRRAAEGEEAAANFLMEKYKGMVRGKARFLHMMGGDAEDMIQEGMIGEITGGNVYWNQRPFPPLPISASPDSFPPRWKLRSAKSICRSTRRFP